MVEELLTRLPATSVASLINNGGSTPLHWSVHSQNPEVIRRLVQAGINVDAVNDDGEAVCCAYNGING